MRSCYGSRAREKVRSPFFRIRSRERREGDEVALSDPASHASGNSFLPIVQLISAVCAGNSFCLSVRSNLKRSPDRFPDSLDLLRHLYIWLQFPASRLQSSAGLEGRESRAGPPVGADGAPQ